MRANGPQVWLRKPSCCAVLLYYVMSICYLNQRIYRESSSLRPTWRGQVKFYPYTKKKGGGAGKVVAILMALDP